MPFDALGKFSKVQSQVRAARAFRDGRDAVYEEGDPRGGSQDPLPPSNPWPYPGRSSNSNQRQIQYCQACSYCDHCDPYRAYGGNYGNAPRQCSYHPVNYMIYTTYGMNGHNCRAGYDHHQAWQARQYSQNTQNPPPSSSPAQYSPPQSSPWQAPQQQQQQQNNYPSQQQGTYGSNPATYTSSAYTQEPASFEPPNRAYTWHAAQRSSGSPDLPSCVRCGEPLQSDGHCNACSQLRSAGH